MTARKRVQAALLAAAVSGAAFLPATSPAAAPPNVILILADDLGYADLSCYGAKRIRTPHIDSLAAEGMRFTDFTMAASVCTPSRAALLTGCYPQRIGMGAPPREEANKNSPSYVLYPKSRYGISPDEFTVAEALKKSGYRTACIGKWHVGDHPDFSPRAHGFDYFYGIPYSNDMKPFEIQRNGEVVDAAPSQETLTERYTSESLRFIRDNASSPFFLYLPLNAPHTPLAVSDPFKGKSKGGLYGDVVECVDWSVGQILAQLKDLGIEKNTLVIFTSDNGPWYARGENGGFATPLRGGKGTTYEGGCRVPCVMRWPDRIPAGAECSEIASAIDFLPTFAALAGAALPADRLIDGKNIVSLMAGDPAARSPHEFLPYYFADDLQAVRSGPWKLKLQTRVADEFRYKPISDHPDATIPEALYNLELDPGEQKSYLKDHPKIAERLRGYARQTAAALGDSSEGTTGTQRRPIGDALEQILYHIYQ